MVSLHHVRASAFALLCFVSTGSTAPITYPNQAYILSGTNFYPVPGAFNVKAVAVEGDRFMAVTRDGRLVGESSGTEGFTNLVAVGLNYTTSAALTADGRVLGGYPDHEPAGLTNVIAIDVAGQMNDDDLDYILAVTSDGRVVTWGRHEEWYPSSADVPGVVAAAGGWSHIVALKNDGTVVEWGVNDVPEPVAGLSNVVAVAAGGVHSVAVKADGTVVAWGENFLQQLDVPAGLSNVVAVSASEYHTLALKSDGTLVAWGQLYFGDDAAPAPNLSNVLAIATSGSRNVVIAALPATVPPPIPYPNEAHLFSGGTMAAIPGFTNIKAFALDAEKVLAVTREGRVLGSGLPEHWLSPALQEQLTNVIAVGVSHVQAAALTADGRVIDLEDEPRWPQPPGLTNVIAFDVAGQHGDDDLDYKLAVTRDGRVVTWGAFGFPPSAEIPGVVAAAGGWNHIVALKSDGTVVEWDIDDGPAAVGLSSVVAVAAGGEHSMALFADGTVAAWGENHFGQLNIPEGLSDVIAIAASEDQSLALKRDGKVVAWGRGYFGEDVTPPPGLANVVAIASGGSHNVALVSHPKPLLGIAADGSAAGQLTISLSGEQGQVYAIETSIDLRAWHFFRQVTNDTGAMFFEVGNTNGTGQFFRARRQ